MKIIFEYIKYIFIFNIILALPLLLILILIIIFFVCNLQMYNMGFWGDFLFFIIFKFPHKKILLIYPFFSSILSLINIFATKNIIIRLILVFFIILHSLLITHSIVNSNITINP